MTSPYITLVDHFVSVHRALQTLLDRCLELAESATLPRDRLQAGFDDAVLLLRAHHVYEDTLLFPTVREAGLEGPWNDLCEDHTTLAAHLDAVARSGDVDALRAICELLPAHFAAEEAHLTSEHWRQVFPTEDDARAFGKATAKRNRELLDPTARLLPLLLYNLDDAHRARFTHRMPRFVVDGLVPYAFRPAWRSRRPFMVHAPPRWTPALLRTRQ